MQLFPSTTTPGGLYPLRRLSLLAGQLPEVAELDLNPVIALPTGCVAVDARVRLTPPSLRSALKSW